MIPKSRGIRKDNGEWVVGWYKYDPRYKKHYICHLFRSDHAICEAWHTTEVIPTTVGQSTGLDDKKGTEIFDHDIIAIDGRETPVQVVWRKKWAGFDFLRMDGNDASAIFGEAPKKYTVIGNIHANPELLTANQDRRSL